MRIKQPPRTVYGYRYEHGSYYHTNSPELHAEGYVYYATREGPSTTLELIKFFDGGAPVRSRAFEA